MPSNAVVAPLINLYLAALAVLAQEARASEHRFDLRALELLARTNPEEFDPRRPLEEPFLNALELDFGSYDFTLNDDQSDVERLWTTLLPELTEHFLGEPVKVTINGPELVVEGDDRAHDAARRALEMAERWLARAWTVELAELPIGALDGLERAVLRASEVDALLAAHPAVDSAQGRVTTRRGARFRRERTAPFLTEYCTLIARGGQGLTDPQVFLARWGHDAVVWVAPHVDGRVLVSCMWRAGEPLGELRRWQVYGPDHAPIELAQGSGSRRVGSAWLEDGSAFVLVDEGDERLEGRCAHGPLLLRIRALADVGPEVDDVEFIGLGAGARSRPWIPPARLNTPSASDDASVEPDSLEAESASDAKRVSALDAPEIDLTALLGEIRAAWESAGMVAVIERLGTEALVAGPLEARALAHRLVHERLTVLARTFSVELRAGVVARASADGFAPGMTLDAAHEVLAALVDRRIGCAALGDPLDLTSARTWMVVREIDMDSRDKLELGEPNIDVVDAGTTLRARVFPSDEGRLTIDIEYLQREAHPPPFPMSEVRSLRHESPAGVLELTAKIEHPESRFTDCRAVLTVTPDVWTVVGLDTKGSNDSAVPVVVIKVSEARASR